MQKRLKANMPKIAAYFFMAKSSLHRYGNIFITHDPPICMSKNFLSQTAYMAGLSCLI